MSLKRIYRPQADTTAIKAISPANRGPDQLVVDSGTGKVWRFDADSSAGASSTVLVPDEGTGRWVDTNTGEGEALAAAEAAQATADDALALGEAAPAMQAVAATLVSGTIEITEGIVVAANSEVQPILIGNITGSTNFATLRERKASRVNGADGVGAITVDAVGSDGLLDSDAAGAIRVLIFTPQEA